MALKNMNLYNLGKAHKKSGADGMAFKNMTLLFHQKTKNKVLMACHQRL